MNKFKKNYLKYLDSLEWKKKRADKLNTINFLCEHCKQNKATQVHHISYKNFKNERPEDLLGVCRRCHLLLEINKIDDAADWKKEVAWCIKEYLKIDNHKQKKDFLKVVLNMANKWDCITKSCLFLPMFCKSVDDTCDDLWDKPISFNQLKDYSKPKGL